MRGLSPAERAAWARFLSDERRLTVQAVLLENKLANDIFYVGAFDGTPCVVKCSSRTPASVRWEYDVLGRLYARDPQCVPRPLACLVSRDAARAALVSERLAGPSLFEKTAHGAPDAASGDRCAEDLLRIARCLASVGIVHRDLHPDNLLFASDGHLRLIDFQFAVDRRAYREDAWMRRRPVYRYVTFGVNDALGIGRWNDADALCNCLSRLPETPAVRKVRAGVTALRSQLDMHTPVSRLARLRIILYRLSLTCQLWFRRNPRRRLVVAARLRKLDRLGIRLKPECGGRAV